MHKYSKYLPIVILSPLFLPLLTLCGLSVFIWLERVELQSKYILICYNRSFYIFSCCCVRLVLIGDFSWPTLRLSFSWRALSLLSFSLSPSLQLFFCLSYLAISLSLYRPISAVYLLYTPSPFLRASCNSSVIVHSIDTKQLELSFAKQLNCTQFKKTNEHHWPSERRSKRETLLCSLFCLFQILFEWNSCAIIKSIHWTYL